MIARYGGSWRGIKPKVAAEHGALGCIIYSDPHEDGYFQGDVFPKGPASARRRAARQRHGHADLSRRSADAGRRRDRRMRSGCRSSEVKTLTKIPVLPISYADAQPLLRRLAARSLRSVARRAAASRTTSGPVRARST